MKETQLFFQKMIVKYSVEIAFKTNGINIFLIAREYYYLQRLTFFLKKLRMCFLSFALYILKQY